MKPALPPPILALSPGTLQDDPTQARRLLETVARARDGGLRGVLLREPHLADRALLVLLGALRRVLGEADGWVGVHDRVHLVRAGGLQGVHVGRRSLSASLVRQLVPPDVAVGFSAHAGDAAEDRAGADYLLLAPVGEVPGKGTPLGEEGLRREVERAAVPVWALGGLAAADSARLRALGVGGVAFVRGLLGADDVTAATRAAIAGWERAR